MKTEETQNKMDNEFILEYAELISERIDQTENHIQWLYPILENYMGRILRFYMSDEELAYTDTEEIKLASDYSQKISGKIDQTFNHVGMVYPILKDFMDKVALALLISGPTLG